MSTPSLGILLLDAHHRRAHAAFALAAAAAGLGRAVTLLASGEGVKAVMEDWSGLDDVGRDVAVRARGVAGFGELRQHALEAGVGLLACESGLRVEAVDPARLLPGVALGDAKAFLRAVGDGQIVSF